MRFRLLSNHELKYLESEFKQFLVVNHIHTHEWKKMNESEPEKALAIVELFSDTVLFKVYEKINYLEFRSKQLFSVYKIFHDRIQAIHIKSEDEKISLENDNEISQSINSVSSKLSIYRAEKKVNPNKEDEVHRLVEQGCINSNEFVWRQFNELIKTSA